MGAAWRLSSAMGPGRGGVKQGRNLGSEASSKGKGYLMMQRARWVITSAFSATRSMHSRTVRHYKDDKSEKGTSY